jgi:hypothetical protein
MLFRVLIRLLSPDLPEQLAEAPEVQGRIAGEMIERGYVERRPPVDDIDRDPTPPTRPHDRAQWDEAAGRWIQWDVTDHEWDPVDGSVEAAREGRSAPPHPDPH